MNFSRLDFVQFVLIGMITIEADLILLLLHYPLELETRINADPMQLCVVVRQAEPSVESAAVGESDRLHPHAGLWVKTVGATCFRTKAVSRSS